jgi:ABC-type lipoprotein release transport system permease subunit
MLVWFALRGLRSSRSFVLLALAVALASGFQISNSANLDGFEADLLDDVLAYGNGDVRISPRDRLRFEDADAVAASVAKLGGAIEAVPLLMYAGAVAGADRRFTAASIYGIDFSVRHPPFRLVARSASRSSETIDVLLGTALAARLEARLGDAVELRVILGPRDPLLGESNVLALHATVRGIVSGTSGGYRAAFVDRAMLARAAGAPGAASMISLHLSDHGAARAAAARIEATRPELEARAWSEDDLGFTSYLEMRRAIGGISYAMVIAAIAIPMWALLYIHVLRKQRELAILVAIGFSRRDLFAIYTLQSMMIAVIGCVLGTGLGYGLTRYFAANPLFEWESLVVRPAVTPATFAVPFAIIVATSVLATLHPTARAALVDPAVALRRIE